MKLTRKQVNEYSKVYTYITKKEIANFADDYKTLRGVENALSRINSEMETEINKPLPIRIELDVNWKRSQTWGHNPSVDMRWEDASGEWHYEERAGYASGCGYDKHSSAVAMALNKFINLRYSVRNKNFKKSPYGIYKSEYSYCYFEGGVGMSCYPRIMDWLGYDMKHVAWTDTYDKWVITKKSERKRFNY